MSDTSYMDNTPITDQEITIKLSEYSELQKQNFIANVVMQWLYNHCDIKYNIYELHFDTYGLNEVLAAVDKPYYDKVLEIKQKEREDGREENRSKEE